MSDDGAVRTAARRVWAPNAERVDIEVAGRRTPMTRHERGWWSADAREAPPGSDYGFVLDGREPALPDPRSGWQPHGVHGLSRTVDHGAFPWTDEGWRPPPLSSGVIYELHVGTFTDEGTFDRAIGRLDHLARLGVTHVELMPVAEFSGSRGWGYDGVNLYAPHHAYGGPDGLKRLVDACHARGLAVLFDVVYNHLGPAGNSLGRFGPYFTDRYTTPWGDAVNFDGAGSDEVRAFLLDNARMWLGEYHGDGLRIDAVHAILDLSATHFLEELAEDVGSLAAREGRDLVLIAESNLNDPRLVWGRERGGYGLDAQWNEDFHHALHAALTGERQGYYADFGRLADVAKALGEGFVYDGRFSRYRQHRLGRSAAGLSGHHFVGCLQNHDQVGNRAAGERTSRLLGLEQLQIAAALVLTAPFVPMLFQGEEWAASTPFQYFTDHLDPALGRTVAEGRRREAALFGWQPDEAPDPQEPATFDRSKLDWSEIEREPHLGMLDWHRRLIHLRRTLTSLGDGRLDRVDVAFEEGGWLAMRRGTITVACNLGTTRRRVPTPGEATEVLCTSDPAARPRRGDVDLGPHAVAILGGEADRDAAGLD